MCLKGPWVFGRGQLGPKGKDARRVDKWKTATAQCLGLWEEDEIVNTLWWKGRLNCRTYKKHSIGGGESKGRRDRICVQVTIKTWFGFETILRYYGI